MTSDYDSDDSHAAWQQMQDKINAYAEAMIRRDQRARHEGKPEHDRDTVGNLLRPGT